MADETLNQEDKKISEGSRTLGEVVNSLPIVKYLITTLPEKLSNFNFLGSVIAELNKQDFRTSNSYEGTTLLTQEEIDFITREGVSQIEDRISEDITREQIGIVIVGGRIDAEASFIQQEVNNMSVEDAGQYFVDYKKVEASVQEKYGNIIETYPELKGYFIEREKEQEEKKVKFEELFRDGYEVRHHTSPGRTEHHREAQRGRTLSGAHGCHQRPVLRHEINIHCTRSRVFTTTDLCC